MLKNKGGPFGPPLFSSTLPYDQNGLKAQTVEYGV